MKDIFSRIVVCTLFWAVTLPLSGCASFSLSVGVSLPFSDTEQEIISSFSEDGVYFPLVVNDEVLDELEALSRSPYSIKKWLSRSQRYAPMMRGIFREYGVPEELVYVAIIESGFDADAVSVKDAGGPWQFIPSTARKMGMRIDEWVDERKDYEKSTMYAAKYLRYFYNTFDDWHLALAGYNCGGAPIRSALKACGDVGLWEMGRQGRLSFQAGGYVPRIIAMIIIMEHPEAYGFAVPIDVTPLEYDKVYVPGGVTLSFMADVLEVKTSTLERLNPELLKGVTPPDVDLYELKVPVGSKPVYLKNFLDAYSNREESLERAGERMRDRPDDFM
ncbi:MAG: lytic transglycosylase domain-containing protein [Deltaproteobacteria bacterium]|nr:lytic transglycosylase domain-containing protein [Candidatus Zymogenaceae bacterium]